MLPSRTLRYARRRAGLTQRELARLAGMPQAAVGRIETGKVTPRVDTLSKLLDLCGCSLEVEPKRGIAIDGTLIRSLLDLSDADRAETAAQSGRNLAATLAASRA
jgi:transcriptional regulator with XRE-family HTH domain